jgi:dUTP pyrophosphatase
MELVVKKLSNKATIPSRGSKLSAGYDLSAAHDIVVPARGKALVMTDLAVVIPDGCYGRIAPRSGFSWKKHTDIGAGVIDADYRGNIGIVVFNHGDNDISITEKQRVAQLILEKIAIVPVVECLEELPTTERADGGYGSTGTH